LEQANKKISGFYHSIIHSIAFVPSLIAIGMAVLAMILVLLTGTDVSDAILNKFPWMKLKSASHASTTITSLLTGMISLIVFSFTIVMLVVNQASTNYSPKLLYKFTEKRLNQLVIGFYIGSIVYFIILLINFSTDGDELTVPDIAFYVAIIFMIINIIFFIVFIHNISSSIQPRKITEELYKTTFKKLQTERGKNKIPAELFSEIKKIVKSNHWHTYSSEQNGYLQTTDNALLKFLKKKDMVVKMEIKFGEYVIKNTPLFSVNQKITDIIKKSIEELLVFYTDERVEENATYGFRQLTEMAVKALSPGINDTGTAILCIDFLSDLLSERIMYPVEFCKLDEANKIRVISKRDTFEELINSSFGPIRIYGGKDITVIKSLIANLLKISYNDPENRHQKSLHFHFTSIVHTAKKDFTEYDYHSLKKFIEENYSNESYFSNCIEIF
jgi:uncharacterized membrane protein